MPSRRCGAGDGEFPLLSGLGLYAAEILGDGNCLFNALSDQLYGHQDAHKEIRQATVDYMRANAAFFKSFIVVNPGGGVRRNPKRKNVAAYSTPYDKQSPTDEEVERVFQEHLDSMSQGGTWGDNVELQAFARAYNVTVKIWQRDFAYHITPYQDGEGRPLLHIAYHTWEHYSSIRNLDGPHSGLPDVRERAISPGTELVQKEKLASAPYAQEWQIDVVEKSLPFLADRVTIRRTLEECKGSIDSAVSKLLDEDSGNTSSAQESSSIEREPDSDDDDEIYGPNKRQNRRNRTAKTSDPTSTSRTIIRPKGQQKRASSKLASQHSSQGSRASSESRTLDPSPPRSTTLEIPDSEDDYKLEPEAGDISAPPSPKKGPTRIRLTMPKPPPDHEAFTGKPAGKTAQKQVGPQGRKRLVTAREKKDIKKQAQKAARKERQKAAATTTLPIMTKSKNNNSSSLHSDAGIKVLYV